MRRKNFLFKFSHQQHQQIILTEKSEKEKKEN